MAPGMLRNAEFKPGQRVLAISDIHGCKALLERLLNKLDYRPGTDALVLAGDLLTKGEENMAMLDFAMELSLLPDVYILLGNCDGMNDEAEAPWLPVFLDRQPRQLFWEQCAAQGIDRDAALADAHGLLAETGGELREFSSAESVSGNEAVITGEALISVRIDEQKKADYIHHEEVIE